MNVSSQTLLQWRQDGKQEVAHGNNGFEVLCGTISVHFLSYVLWIERGHHVEGKGKETASLHSSMPIFIEQQQKNPPVSEATTEGNLAEILKALLQALNS